MKTYSLFLKLLLTRLHPSSYDYVLVLHYAHSPTEWNICLIIKQTINKSTLFTKKKLSTGSLHYKELCEEQRWPGGFLSPPVESYSKWKEASSFSRSRLTDKPALRREVRGLLWLARIVSVLFSQWVRGALICSWEKYKSRAFQNKARQSWGWLSLFLFSLAHMSPRNVLLMKAQVSKHP